jgi:hypothetical protein
MATSEYYNGWRERSSFDLSTRENFVPDENDREYPKFNEGSIEEFYNQCEKHEKLFFSNACAQQESKGLKSINTQPLLDLLDRGYCWSVCAYNWAVSEGYDDIIQKMIDFGQHPDSGYDSDGWTPMMHLANGKSGKKNKETIKLLLRAGANPDKKGFRYCLPRDGSCKTSSRSFRDHLEDYNEDFREELKECLKECEEMECSELCED